MDKKKIIDQVNMALTMLKMKEKEHASEIQSVIDVINGQLTKKIETVYFIEDFTLFQDVLMKFNVQERGFIFSKFLERNLLMANTTPYTYVRDGLYTNSFLNFGISSHEILSVYFDFCFHEEDFHISFSYIDHVESIISYLLNTTTAGNVFLTTLKNHGSNERASKYFGIVRGLQQVVSHTDKTYEAFYQAFQNDPYLIRARDTLCHITHISKEDAVFSFIDYILHHNLDEFKARKELEFKSFLHHIKEIEEQERLRKAHFYQDISTFLQKEKREVSDYQMILPLLLMEFPLYLVEGYVSYLMEEDTYENSKEEVISKKTLKQELSKYYSYRENILFDYHNFGHLLELLKQLNYSDSRVEDVFHKSIQNAIKNDAYYAYLLERSRYYKESQSKILEIDFYLELLCYAKSKEEWEDYHNQIIFLCEQLGFNATSLQYEQVKLQKVFHA